MKPFAVLCSSAVVLVAIAFSPSSANPVYEDLMPVQPKPEVTKGILGDSPVPIVKRNALPDGEGTTCWWTGCQLDSWAITGCDQYGMREVERDSCAGGTKFHCCN